MNFVSFFSGVLLLSLYVSAAVHFIDPVDLYYNRAFRVLVYARTVPESYRVVSCQMHGRI